MNKTIKALQKGKVLKYNSIYSRYYKMIDGSIHYSETMEKDGYWKKSSARMSVFTTEENWTIL